MTCRRLQSACMHEGGHKVSEVSRRVGSQIGCIFARRAVKSNLVRADFELHSHKCVLRVQAPSTISYLMPVRGMSPILSEIGQLGAD